MKRGILLLLIVIANVYLAEAVRLEYNETDLVSLKPTATDLDADRLVYSYSPPLDADGKWQTKYGDAGEYKITVTVSDGELSSSQDVTLAINKKEVGPVINSFSPADSELEVDEGKSLELNIAAEDPNKDSLSYTWKVDDKSVGEGISFVYKPNYEYAGLHKIKVIINGSNQCKSAHNYQKKTNPTGKP